MSDNTAKRRRLIVNLDEKTWEWLTNRAKKNWRSRTKELGLILFELAASEKEDNREPWEA